MCTVALIGADGAGKSTIGRRLAATLPLPAKYLYMGDNADSANRLLPSTRLLRLLRRVAGGRRGERRGTGPSAGAPPDTSRPAARPRGVRGHLNIAPGAPRRTLAGRIHGFLLSHLYPKPDVVICLDAPAEVLFARKPEGTVEAIERRRREYFQIRPFVKHFAVVDATQPEEAVTRAVAALIGEFCGSTARRRPRKTDPA